MQATTEATFTQAATRRRFAVVRDRYNNLVRGARQDLADIPVSLYQEDGDEDTDDRDQQRAEFRARVPIGTDITGRDQLIVDDVAYEVVGPPLDARTHLRLSLKHVDG